MTRHTASVISFATASAAAVVATATISTGVLAESMEEYTTAFRGTLSRAEVQAAFMRQPALLRLATGEAGVQHEQPVALKSGLTRAQTISEFKASRLEAMALVGEDSGSAYLKANGWNAKTTAAMGNSAAPELGAQPAR